MLPFRRVTMYLPTEFDDTGHDTDKIAKVAIWRSKTRSEQDLSIFNDRDCFLMDWYFLMGYSMIMDDKPSDAMFRSFMKDGQSLTHEDDDEVDDFRQQAVETDELEDITTTERSAPASAPARKSRKRAITAVSKRALHAHKTVVDQNRYTTIERASPAESSAVATTGRAKQARTATRKCAAKKASLRSNLIVDLDNNAMPTESLRLAKSTKEAAAAVESKQSKAISKYFKDVLFRVAEDAEVFNEALGVGAMEESLVMGSDLPASLPFAQAPYAASLVGSDLAFSPLITSHSLKRLAVNEASEKPQIKTSWVCLRAGWMMKAVHTIFDYLDHNAKSDRQVARSYANWRDDGGRPPSLEALKGSGDDVNASFFSACLFSR